MPHRPARTLATLALLATSCTPESRRVAASAPAEPSAQQQPPHVVVYLIDTLRADALGCYGSVESRTPNLDALAADAAVFTRAASVAPWTVPAVASLMTSTYPSVHGVVRGGVQVPEEVPTLCEVLRGAGYGTVLVTYSPFGGSATGLDRGYDHVFESEPGTKSEGMREALATVNWPFVEWLEGREAGGPFFASLHTVEPHYPLNQRHVDDLDPASLEELNRLFTEYRLHTYAARGGDEQDGRRIPVRRLERKRRARLVELHADLTGRLAEARAGYLAAVAAADAHLGRAVDALKAADLWDETVFVAVSDHGEEFGEHGFWLHDHSLFDELVHVPLIVRVPGRTDGGLRIDEPVSTIDVAPTLAELAGAESGAPWQGRSLLPRIDGHREARTVVAERINVDKRIPGVTERRGERETAVILGRWKLIVHHDVDRVSLFDVEADPGETVDVTAEHPAVVAELRERLAEWRAQQEPWKVFEARREGLGATQLERLKELGYAESPGR